MVLVAALTIAPLQDVLDLGIGSRMNVPGCVDGNWRWRVTEEMLSTSAFEWLRDLTERSKRRSNVDSRLSGKRKASLLCERTAQLKAEN